jgi:hypothetical protein
MTAKESLAHRSEHLQFSRDIPTPFLEASDQKSTGTISYGVLKSGLASSSGDAVSGCSAFQRIAAVMRVRPLG